MSWPLIPAESTFGTDALPYGIFAPPGGPDRVGVRLGDHVLDLHALALARGLDIAAIFAASSLNPFLELGSVRWREVRSWLRDELAAPAPAGVIHPLSDVSLRLPIEVGDYVDFYASEHHATNVGRIFRPDDSALTPNWKHLPIGYHGRSGTVVVSGTDVVRPMGQRKAAGASAPTFGRCERLDIEAELGFVVGGATSLGSRIPIEAAREHLFGVVLLNDWSARDIQAWEYVPLGPFLGKSFATSISAWVLPLDALAGAEVPLPGQDPAPLPYLAGDGVFGLDIHLEVRINGQVVSRPEYRDMYWSPAQMLAHMTVNGASVRAGDLFGSGTVSGAGRDTRGSLLELSWGGREPFTLADGTTRAFLEDGDEVVITAWAPGPDGGRVGLGEVAGRILPARD